MTRAHPLKMRLTSPLLALALVAPLGACAPTLAGQLRAADGQPFATSDARVNVVSLAPTDPKAVVVGVETDGSFAVDDSLAPGPYMVEAIVPGYGLVSQRVTVGEQKAVELQLTRLPPTKAPTIGANLEGDAARGAGGATLTPPNL
jgi:hypothetical protein